MGYHEAILGLDEPELDTIAIEQRQIELALDMITDGKSVHELLFDFDADDGLDISTQIARAMRSIDAACKGNQAHVDACLAALSNIQRELKAKAFMACEDRAIKDMEA